MTNNDTKHSQLHKHRAPYILKREKCWKKEKFQKSIIYDIPAEVYIGIELISFLKADDVTLLRSVPYANVVPYWKHRFLWLRTSGRFDVVPMDRAYIS